MNVKAVFRKSEFVKLMRTIFSVGTACVLSSNGSVAQDNFCTVLLRVTAAASSGNNLDSLKSQKRGPFVKNYWYANRDIPGFKDCYIKESTGDTYLCSLEMNSPKAAEAKTHEMEAAMRACLPKFTREVSTVHEAPSLFVTYYLSVSLKHSVTVKIQYVKEGDFSRFVSLIVEQLIIQ